MFATPGALLAGHVPLTALVSPLVKKDKGAAMAILALGAGLPVFVEPAYAWITGLNYQRLKEIFYPNKSCEVIEKELRENQRAGYVASMGARVVLIDIGGNVVGSEEEASALNIQSLEEQ